MSRISLNAFASNPLTKITHQIKHDYGESGLNRTVGLVIAVAAGVFALLVAGPLAAIVVTGLGIVLAISLSRLKMAMQGNNAKTGHYHSGKKYSPILMRPSQGTGYSSNKKPGSRSSSSSSGTYGNEKKPGSRGTSSSSSSGSEKKPGSKGGSSSSSSSDGQYKKPGGRRK